MKLEELNKDDQIFYLQQELQHAMWSLEFLHKCLIDPEHNSYEYPKLNLNRIEKIKSILPIPSLCGHSVRKMDCDSCRKNEIIYIQTKEIEKKLDG